jgi:LuxR family transcriptional regulator, maltose regulon positive regulatory protein
MSGVRPPGRESEDGFVVARTKLSVPVPRLGSRIVARPRLLDVLDDGLSARVTLVCAPTGWGKTTALAEWAGISEDRFVWVSLDSGDDNEPVRFWRCVVAALRSGDPESARVAMRRLGSPVVSIIDEVLPALINDLAEVATRLVLVIDDYHLIVRPEIHHQLSYLIRHLPLSTHLVVIAHAEPPVRLGRLRAMGDVRDIGPEQLRFSDQEAAELLNRVHGLDLTAEEVATVQERIEGWVAGLNLAALSLKRDERRGQILEALPDDDRFLVDYLWDEVVMSQPPPVRQFLVRTSILESFSGALADALTGRSDGVEMVRQLERANLFVVPLDREHVWFRYHHLFRGLLLGQLKLFGSELIADLHRRASTWYADHGLMIEAIEHAIAAGDMHYAADEIERRWFALWSAGEVWTLVSWLDRLSADAIAAHPLLAVVRAGMARTIGRVDEIEEWLARVEPSSAEDPAPGLATSIEGAVAEVRSLHRLAIGDIAGAIDQGQLAWELEPVPGSREHAGSAYFLGCALFFDDPGRAVALLREFLEVIPGDQYDPRRLDAMAVLAEDHALRGEIEVAEQLARTAMEVTLEAKLEEFPSAHQLHISLGAVLLARGDLDAAEEQFERAVMLSRRAGDRVDMAHTLLWLAAARVRQGDAEESQKALADARALLPGLGQSSMRRLVESLSLNLDLTPGTRTPSTSHERLSQAELRVLRLMPGDLTYREIAQRLYLSRNTVRTHARQVLRKLGASSRAAAVARARERDLL